MKVERTIWITRDISRFGEHPEYWDSEPYAESEGGMLIWNGKGMLFENNLDDVPTTVQDLAQMLSPGDVARCVLIDATWSLRHPHGA